jgi:hypothetical protein
MNERMKPTAISPLTRSVMQRRHMILFLTLTPPVELAAENCQKSYEKAL